MHGTISTILVYAWLCSYEDLRTAVFQENKEIWQRKTKDTIILDLYMSEIQKIAQETLYGRLLQVQAGYVDPWPIAAALDTHSGIYFDADLQQQRIAHAKQLLGTTNPHTSIFCEELAQNAELRGRLEHLSKAWHGDAIKGGRMLHTFFLWHSHLFLRTYDVAFFVQEFIRLGLEAIDWEAIAIQLMQQTSSRTKELHQTSTATNDTMLHTALFHETVLQLQAEFARWGQDTCLSEAMRALATGARSSCEHAAQQVQRMRAPTENS